MTIAGSMVLRRQSGDDDAAWLKEEEGESSCKHGWSGREFERGWSGSKAGVGKFANQNPAKSKRKITQNKK